MLGLAAEGLAKSGHWETSAGDVRGNAACSGWGKRRFLSTCVSGEERFGGQLLR